MLKITMKSSHCYLVVLGIMALLGVSAMSFSSLAFAEIDTDMPVYSKGQPVEISGILDLPTGETVNIVKIEIINLNDENNKIVDEYAPVDDSNAFSRLYETVTWEAGEYKVTIRYDESNEEVEFEISDFSSSSLSDDGNDTVTGSEDGNDTVTGSEDGNDTITPGSSSTTSDDDTTTSQQQEPQFSIPSTPPSGLPVDPQANPASSNELDITRNENLALKSTNQQLQSENNQLKTQIEELNKRVEQLDAIVKEQISVMMESLAIGSTIGDDDTITPGTGSDDDDDTITPGTGSDDDDDDDDDDDAGIPEALIPSN